MQDTGSPYMHGTKCGVQDSAAVLRNMPRAHLATREAQKVPIYRPTRNNVKINMVIAYYYLL